MCAMARMRAGAHDTGVQEFRDYTAETGMTVPGPHDPRYSTPPRGSLTRWRRRLYVYASAPECYAWIGVRLPRKSRAAGGDNDIAGGCIEYRMGTRFAQAWSPHTGAVTAQEVCTYRANITSPRSLGRPAVRSPLRRFFTGVMRMTTRSPGSNQNDAAAAHAAQPSAR